MDYRLYYPWIIVICCTVIENQSRSLSLELLKVPDEVRDSDPVPVGLGGVCRPDALLRRPQHLGRHAALPRGGVPRPLLLLEPVARLQWRENPNVSTKHLRRHQFSKYSSLRLVTSWGIGISVAKIDCHSI